MSDKGTLGLTFIRVGVSPGISDVSSGFVHGLAVVWYNCQHFRVARQSLTGLNVWYLEGPDRQTRRSFALFGRTRKLSLMKQLELENMLGTFSQGDYCHSRTLT